MSIKLIESFTWVDNSNAGKAALGTRYNNAGQNFNIAVGGGRFGGNALKLQGDGWFFEYYGGAMGPDVVFGFAVNFPSGTTGLTAELFSLYQTAAGNDEQVSLRFDSSGAMRITRQNTTLATGATVLQSNAWYYIEFAVHFDQVNGSATMWINGVVDATVSGVNTQPQALAQTALAKLGNAANPFYCDMYGMDATLVNLGPRRVSCKFAVSDGSNLDWAPSAGPTQFNLVNTVPPNNDVNGFIASATPGDKSTFFFGPLPYAPLSVDAVQVGMYARFDDGGPHLIAPVIVSGPTTDTGTPQSIAASYLDFYLQIYEQDPNGSVPWNAATVDAAQYGVDLDT